MNWQGLIQLFETELQQLYSKREQRVIAQAFLWNRANLNLTKALVLENLPIDLSELQKDLKRLQKGEPHQYVLESAPFRGMDLWVNQNVLIPRPETEELVEWIKKVNPNSFNKALDIGTGSGCIALSLASEGIAKEVIGLDVSQPAIEVATKNASKLTKIGAINWVCESIETFRGKDFDLIVSNPPYVLEKDQHEMANKVLDHEPHLALFVKDEDPLRFYRIITQKARTMMTSGFLFFEIHELYAEQVKVIMEQEGFNHIEIKVDINGKDRMIKGVI